MFVVTEYLVFTAGEVMMVAVAAELKEHNAADDVVAVPAVDRHSPLVSACCYLAALQAVMLDVINRFQQKDSHKSGSNKKQGGQPPKKKV